MGAYQTYLTSPHWRTFRARWHKSDEARRCYVCGAWGKFDLHHLTYERVGRERTEDIVTLCRRCHDAVHALAKERPDLGTIATLPRQLRKALGKRRDWRDECWRTNAKLSRYPRP